MLPSRGPLTRPENLSVIAKRGEELGYSFLMFPDHIVMPRDVSPQYPYSQSGVFPGGRTVRQVYMITFLWSGEVIGRVPVYEDGAGVCRYAHQAKEKKKS